jgi:hypothetical protein
MNFQKIEQSTLISFFFFLVGLEFELRAFKASGLNHISNSFYCGYFGDGVSQTIYLGWPPTVILQILAFQVARITRHEPLVPPATEFLTVI